MREFLMKAQFPFSWGLESNSLETFEFATFLFYFFFQRILILVLVFHCSKLFFELEQLFLFAPEEGQASGSLVLCAVIHTHHGIGFKK